MSHDPSGGAYSFGTFLKTGLTFTAYAVNLYLASLGNVQRSSLTSLTFSFSVCVAFVFYQIPYAWWPKQYDWIVSVFSDVAPSFFLDVKTPGIDSNDAPSGLQLATLTAWMLITLIYFIHILLDSCCGQGSVWRCARQCISYLPGKCLVYV